jgi:hypothetical protein
MDSRSSHSLQSTDASPSTGCGDDGAVDRQDSASISRSSGAADSPPRDDDDHRTREHSGCGTDVDVPSVSESVVALRGTGRATTCSAAQEAAGASHEPCVQSLTTPSPPPPADARASAMDPREECGDGQTAGLDATASKERPPAQTAPSGEGALVTAAGTRNEENATSISSVFQSGRSSVGEGIVVPTGAGQGDAVGSSSPLNHPSHTPSDGTRQGAMQLPGAFPIAGPAPNIGSPQGTYYDTMMSLMDDERTISPHSRMAQRQVVSAVLVGDDDRDQEIDVARREAHVAEQERRLAEQAAKLQAWQEQLEQKQLELAQSQGQIVEAEVIPTPSSLTSNVSSLAFRIPSLLGGGGMTFGGSSDRKVPAVQTNDGGEEVSEALTTIPDHGTLDLTGLDLDDGPLRFAPIGERSLEEQVMSLNASDRRCYKNLKQRWDDRKSKKGDSTDFPRDAILRFARNNMRNGQFFEEKAWRVRKCRSLRAQDFNEFCGPLTTFRFRP